MRWPILVPSLLLLLPPPPASAITGHGPRGVHPINERYMAVVDSSIDAVLIVDGQAGGAVVGHVVLHDRSLDDDAEKWLNPIGVATCDSCRHLFVTSENTLHVVDLDRPLGEMAADGDFSSLSSPRSGASSSAAAPPAARPLWPSGWPAGHRNDGGLRSVSVAPDGSSAYVGHALAGVFSFDPTNPVEEDPRAGWAIATGDAGVGAGVSGLHHTPSLRNLVVTREETVHIVKILDGGGGNPLESGRPPEAYELDLAYHCDYLYGGDDDPSVGMVFADTVIIGDYAFVLGRPRRSPRAPHNGVAVYRLTWDEDGEAWHHCVQVAGDGLLAAGWVDGVGRDSRFSNTPRDLAVLPRPGAHVLVVADVGNRALRYVDVTVPVESRDDDKAGLVRVSTVAYDEDLYRVLYAREDPWIGLTLEGVMNQDGKSYYHSGPESLRAVTLDDAQDECARVGAGRVCTLPEIRARFARGQYPTIDANDGAWTTVWTAESCSSCHLASPGRCPLTGGKDTDDSWGSDVRMIANFSPRTGLQTQCVRMDEPVSTFSMCCGVGGPSVTGAKPPAAPAAQAKVAQAEVAQAEVAQAEVAQAEVAQKKAGISFGVVIPMLLIAAAAYGVYMRKRAKPGWWPKFLRNDQREETGHAPHREVDLRGRDYI